MNFKYHTKDAKGIDRDGTIEASDEMDAVKKLKEQGLIIISIEKEQDKPPILKINFILAISVISIVLFTSGVFYSNYITKKNKSIGEANKIEYEKRFLETTYSLIANTQVSLTIIDGTSQIWRKSIESDYSDFNLEIQEYLIMEKGILDKSSKTDEKIILGMQKLKDYPIQYQEAYNTLMELHGVYSQLYSLANSPSGTLMSFNNKVNDLQSDFTKVLSKLKIYMPILEDKGNKSLE
jgi:hypothetical protein